MGSFLRFVGSTALKSVVAGSLIGCPLLIWQYTYDPQGSLLHQFCKWKCEGEYRDFINIDKKSTLENGVYSPPNQIFKPGVVILEEIGGAHAGALMIQDELGSYSLGWRKEAEEDRNNLNSSLKKMINNIVYESKAICVHAEFIDGKKKYGKYPVNLPGNTWPNMALAVLAYPLTSSPDSVRAISPEETPQEFQWRGFLFTEYNGYYMQFTYTFPPNLVGWAAEIKANTAKDYRTISSYRKDTLQHLLEEHKKATTDSSKICSYVRERLLTEVWLLTQRGQTTHEEMVKHFGQQKEKSPYFQGPLSREHILNKDALSVTYPPQDIDIDGEKKVTIVGQYVGPDQQDFITRFIRNRFLDVEDNIIRHNLAPPPQDQK